MYHKPPYPFPPRTPASNHRLALLREGKQALLDPATVCVRHRGYEGGAVYDEGARLHAVDCALLVQLVLVALHKRRHETHYHTIRAQGVIQMAGEQRRNRIQWVVY